MDLENLVAELDQMRTDKGMGRVEFSLASGRRRAYWGEILKAEEGGRPREILARDLQGMLHALGLDLYIGPR